MRCDSCIYASQGELNPETLKKPLTCKRYPPTPQLLPTPQGITIVTINPEVQESGYCGEHVPKLTLAK